MRGERRFSDDAGATLLEYGFVLALIALVLIGVVELLGENTIELFRSL